VVAASLADTLPEVAHTAVADGNHTLLSSLNAVASPAGAGSLARTLERSPALDEQSVSLSLEAVDRSTNGREPR